MHGCFLLSGETLVRHLMPAVVQGWEGSGGFCKTSVENLQLHHRRVLHPHVHPGSTVSQSSAPYTITVSSIPDEHGCEAGHTRVMNIAGLPMGPTSVDIEWGAKKLYSQDEAANTHTISKAPTHGDRNTHIRKTRRCCPSRVHTSADASRIGSPVEPDGSTQSVGMYPGSSRRWDARPHRTRRAVIQPARVPVEAHLVRDVEPRQLPRVLVVEPWVGGLHAHQKSEIILEGGTHLKLVACGRDQLLEDPVLIPQPVPPHRQLPARARVEVARGKVAEAAVPQRCVALLVEHVFHAEAEALHALCVLVLQPEVEECVVEGSSTLGRLAGVLQGGLVPVDEEVVADGEGGGLYQGGLVASTFGGVPLPLQLLCGESSTANGVVIAARNARWRDRRQALPRKAEANE
ncbi:hypothetical protein B0H14DRAFT_2626050 [Mycena olivaceomarginata]|nr:hypothetical protein B0H14DRAFT_2626050 [Mycena olivaceomarginata]